jgi:predicted metalloendopeptidase
MVQRVEAAFEANLATLSWMDEATRTKAKDKVHKMANKIGYTDSWRDYAALEVGTDSLLKNQKAGQRFASLRELAKIGKPLDRNEHQMPPTLVNAQYNPTMNDMTFPAAILQPPFFSAESFAAANYGGIAMVVGHELTHGFDDEGRQFDGDGNLKDWWTKESGEAYTKKAACVAKQYSSYQVLPAQTVDGKETPAQFINGELTLGENIADNGGLKLAFLAFKELRKGAAPVLQGTLTEDQQFFLGFAQSWCSKFTPQMLKLQAQTDPHSNARFRVNGSAANSLEFAAAFSCKAGSKMAPAERCLVW